MREFKDNQGRKYTEQDLNRLDTMPANCTFNSLDLRGTEVTRLPQNLTVYYELLLNNTRIKELPKELTVGTLVLRNCEVRALPQGLSVENLYLMGSKVESIGPGLSVGDLFINSTHMFNHLIKCQRCQVETNRASEAYELLDMRNIQMEALYFISENSHYQIKHAEAHTCAIILAEEKMKCHYEFSDSTFELMNVKIPNGSALILGKNTKVKQVRVDSNHRDVADLNLAICQAEIEDLVLSGLLSKCRVSELVLNGSMTVERIIGEPLIPAHGLIYGDLTIPSNRPSLIPPSLCCIGNLILTEP